jgi:hypothetical protein
MSAAACQQLARMSAASKACQQLARMSAASNLAANYSHRRLLLRQKSNTSAASNACPQHVSMPSMSACQQLASMPSMPAASPLSRTHLRLSQSPTHYSSHPPPYLTSIRPSCSHGGFPRGGAPHLRLRARQEVERLPLRWRIRVSICAFVLVKQVN